MKYIISNSTFIFRSGTEILSRSLNRKLQQDVHVASMSFDVFAIIIELKKHLLLPHPEFIGTRLNIKSNYYGQYVPVMSCIFFYSFFPSLPFHILLVSTCVPCLFSCLLSSSKDSVHDVSGF